MPSGYRRKGVSHWWVKFLGVPDPETGERRRVAEACPKNIETKEQADEYARMRELQAKLYAGSAPRERQDPGVRRLVLSHEITIMEAALRHPATVREAGSCQRDFRRHERDVKVFVRRTGIKFLSDLTIEGALDYIAAMRREGMSYTTRRHAMLWIKRAAAMAPSYGLENVLGEIKLDRNGGAVQPVEALCLAEIASRIDAALALEDRRVAGIIALGVTCGLRPTEICRLRQGDLDCEAATLQVGTGAAKNASSVRLVPVSRIAVGIVRPLLDKDRDAPIFTNGKVGIRPIDIYKLSKLITPHLIARPKVLRKSFATIAALELRVDERVVEGMLGHAYSGFAQVTRKSYLARARVEQLKPAAEAFDAGFARVAKEMKLERIGTIVNHAITDI